MILSCLLNIFGFFIARSNLISPNEHRKVEATRENDTFGVHELSRIRSYTNKVIFAFLSFKIALMQLIHYLVWFVCVCVCVCVCLSRFLSL